jgi:hypothetical protein
MKKTLLAGLLLARGSGWGLGRTEDLARAIKSASTRPSTSRRPREHGAAEMRGSFTGNCPWM